MRIMDALFAEWIKGFDPMTNPENKTLVEIREEAFLAGFNAREKYTSVDNKWSRWEKIFR